MPWTERNLEVNWEPCFHHSVLAAETLFNTQPSQPLKFKQLQKPECWLAPKIWANHNLHKIVTNPNPVVIAVFGFITPTQPMKIFNAHATVGRLSPIPSQHIVSHMSLLYCENVLWCNCGQSEVWALQAVRLCEDPSYISGSVSLGAAVIYCTAKTPTN